MAFVKIQTDFDLTGIAAFASTAVADPSNVNLAWEITGATDETQVVNLEWWVQVGEETIHQMPDAKKVGGVAISKAKGNDVDNTNYAGINATSLQIKIVPPADGVGTLNLWTLNS